MPWYKSVKIKGEIHCHEPGKKCHAGVVEEGGGVDVDFIHFLSSNIEPENRKEYHDEILVRLTEDMNRLIKEAQRKRPDRRLGIMTAPDGLFFCWMTNKPLTDRKGATEINDDNIERMFGLTK
jgi:hypothetical protein